MKLIRKTKFGNYAKKIDFNINKRILLQKKFTSDCIGPKNSNYTCVKVQN
jgi:hypothetical protein